MKQLLITIAALVLVGCGPSNPDKSIEKAAFNGNIEAVKQHLAAGTDVNAKDEDGYTLIHAVAGGGDKEIAELLIANGADVNAKRNDGETPLHRAVQEGHKEIVELLIDKGADVNAKGRAGHTPLIYTGTKEIAELLIAKCADVNALIVSGPSELRGKTPLDFAEDHPEIADLLRKHGGKTGEELKAEGK